MMPEPLSRWMIAAYAAVVACFVGGVACAAVGVTNHTVATFAATFYVVPAAYGAVLAARELRMHFWLTGVVKDNRKMPVAIQIDGETGYATIGRFDGQMVSLHIPEEILEAGPEVVMAFVIDALED